MTFHLKRYFAFLMITAVLCACSGEEYTPKPIGYYRIELAQAEYRLKALPCPFEFETSQMSRIEYIKSRGENIACLFDISYPKFKGRVHMTYLPVNGNLRDYLEESRSFTYEHQIKASRIASSVINRPRDQVYGLAYDLDGDVASSFQFYLTDSTSHFVRGALYFETRPNSDSIQPVLTYVKNDIWHLIETFRWQEEPMP